MLLYTEHITRLTYSVPITETIMEARLTPRNDEHQSRRAFRIDVGPRTQVYEHVDWLENRVHQFSIIPPHSQVVIASRSVVQLHPKHPSLEELLAIPPATIDDFRILDYTRPNGPIQLSDSLRQLAETLQLDSLDRPAAVADRITQKLRDHIEYKKGVTTSATAVDEVLDHRSGVCQDLAHVAIGLLRGRGIPARYISGYYYASDQEAELETHAWFEAYLSGYGWMPFDPTHQRFGADDHVVLAIGRDFSDVPPNRGVYHGNAEETLSAKVTVREVDQVPEGLAATEVSEVSLADEAAPPSTRPEHREAIDYQEEQQQQ